eukprot:TRINITY_DN1523_c0_g1_i1.p1 TRINITY_DN1523_c0_g1~~TRINITY_DN1523_c0_g1_i1.p1  ORF type:complete len:174 (-),score=32.74 TRINITY_DN1523_c0_g1_i1:197-718(-)
MSSDFSALPQLSDNKLSNNSTAEPVSNLGQKVVDTLSELGKNVDYVLRSDMVADLTTNNGNDNAAVSTRSTPTSSTTDSPPTLSTARYIASTPALIRTARRPRSSTRMTTDSTSTSTCCTPTALPLTTAKTQQSRANCRHRHLLQHLSLARLTRRRTSPPPPPPPTPPSPVSL